MKLEVILEDKTKHPFMRGMLAHKLIQRGLSFDQAYQIAEDAKSFFQEQSEVTSESLMKSVDKLIVSRYGESLLKGLTTDLFPSGKQIIVFRRKANAPFSKGLLTQSITASGLKPEEAFRVAFDLEKKLINNKMLRISKQNLFEEVFKIIKKKYNSHTASLYKLASRIDELDRPLIIYLGGASGTGKSVMSTFLALIPYSGKILSNMVYVPP